MLYRGARTTFVLGIFLNALVSSVSAAALEQWPALDNKRWLAQFKGEFVATRGSTQMVRTQHYGPLRVQRPFHPEGRDCLHLYLLHPPGGLVGGDRLSIELQVQQQAHVLMTTPSAGKIYNNISGLTQGQHVTLNVEAGGILEYLPQENIVFNGADGELTTEIELQGDGLFVGWEITCLGRFESQQFFEQGRLKQSLMVRRDGQPLFSDRLGLEAPSLLQQGMTGFQKRHVFGTFVISRDVMALSESLEQAILDWQQQINADSPVTQVAVTQKPDVFIARILGDKAEQVRNSFEQLWQILRPEVVGREACPPRIWRT